MNDHLALVDIASQAHKKDTAAALASAALATNTRASYHTALERLSEWLGDAPLTDEALADHVLSLHQDGLAPGSITIVVAAVKFYADALGQPNPAGTQTQNAMKYIRRDGRDRGNGQVLGMRWEQADAAAAVACSEEDSLSGLRDAAIICVMSDALLRVSECAALNVADVRIEDDGTGRLTIRYSKTDQDGEGMVLYLGPPTVKRLCDWLTAAAIEAGPLFRRIRRGNHVQEDRLTPRALQAIIKSRALAAGVEGRISGHSLRVGSAQSLAAAGAGVVEMQQAGRWTSPDMPGRYARAQLADRGAVARLRYGR